jgi:hypothetical protein
MGRKVLYRCSVRLRRSLLRPFSDCFKAKCNFREIVATLRPNLDCHAVCVVGLVAINDDLVRVDRRAVDEMTARGNSINRDAGIP